MSGDNSKIIVRMGPKGRIELERADGFGASLSAEDAVATARTMLLAAAYQATPGA